jgi:hypothetical protein
MEGMTMLRSKWWVLVAVFALVGAACASATEKIAENAIESVIESESGGDVSVDLGSDGDISVSVEGEDGSSLQVGGAAEVPDELTFPVPDGGEVNTALTDSSYVAVSIQYPTDQFDDIVSFYDDWTSGTGDEWSRSESTIDMGEGLTQRSAQWVNGSNLISVADCFTLETGSSSFGAICLNVNESK